MGILSNLIVAVVSETYWEIAETTNQRTGVSGYMNTASLSARNYKPLEGMLQKVQFRNLKNS